MASIIFDAFLFNVGKINVVNAYNSISNIQPIAVNIYESVPSSFKSKDKLNILKSKIIKASDEIQTISNFLSNTVSELYELDDQIMLKTKNFANGINSNNMNILALAAYSGISAEQLLHTLTEDEIKFCLNNKVFKPENINRYVKYKEKNNLPLKNAILLVNMDLDKACYADPNTVNNPNNLLVVVNKHNKLPNNYTPSDLASINQKYTKFNMYLRKSAAKSFEKMCESAKNDNVTLLGVSGYRSFNGQSNLYNNTPVNRDLLAARPRFSEHETGLAIDINGVNGISEGTQEYNWLKENAHQYGYILRYPKGKENITGYGFEPWHYRYVGKETAEYIYNNNLTFEEYSANPIK